GHDVGTDILPLIGDIGSASGARLQKSFALELLQGVAQGVARDPESLGQDPGRGKPVVEEVVPLHDFAPHVSRNLRRSHLAHRPSAKLIQNCSKYGPVGGKVQCFGIIEVDFWFGSGAWFCSGGDGPPRTTCLQGALRRMAFPEHVDYVIVGAGIHGMTTAWKLAERLQERGEKVEGRIIILDKAGVAAGASGVACGVVRNNYFQPAMRRLMAHSVEIWESDPKGLSYHPVGYLQISCEAMRDDVGTIFAQQQA